MLYSISFGVFLFLLHILAFVKIGSFTLQYFLIFFFKKHTKFSKFFDYIRFNKVKSYILAIKNRLLMIMLYNKLDLIRPSGLREKVQECEKIK